MFSGYFLGCSGPDVRFRISELGCSGPDDRVSDVRGRMFGSDVRMFIVSVITQPKCFSGYFLGCSGSDVRVRMFGLRMSEAGCSGRMFGRL